LITPRLVVQDGDSLEFGYRGSSTPGHTFRESLEIRISTVSTDTADFVNRLWLHGFEDRTWVDTALDLSAYARDSIYIAFRSCGIGNSSMRIDDVSGPSIWQPQTDFAVAGIAGVPGFLSPGDSVTPTGVIKNNGMSSVSGTVSCEMRDSASGSVVYSQSSPSPIIAPGDTSSVAMPLSWPSVAGTYSVMMRAMLSGDQDSLNDSYTTWLHVSWTREVAYDDGIPATPFYWTSGGNGHGVHLYPSRHPARLTSFAVGMHNAGLPIPGGDSLQFVVLADNGPAGSPGETLLDLATQGVRRGGWNHFDVAAADIAIDSGGIYVFAFQSDIASNSPAIDLDMTDDAPESTQWVYYQRQYSLKRRDSHFRTGDFLIRATFCESQGDVGARWIVAPTDSIPEGIPVIPQAWVRNYCSRPSGDFPVILRIGSGYADRTTVPNVNPGDSALTSFRAWTPIRGTYSVTCSTAHPWDTDSSNDRASGTVTAWSRDAGASRILSPVADISLGDSVRPSLWVRNHGSTNESIPATVIINRGPVTVYSASAGTRLNAGDSAQLAFSFWRPDSTGDYLVTAYTSLAGDMNRANDTTRAACRVTYHDVGAVMVVAPGDTVAWRSTVTPTAVVRNFGSEPETFWTEFTITGAPGVAYRDSSQPYLHAGDTMTLAFAPWQPDTGSYLLRVFTRLTDDRNRNNDTVHSECFAALADVAALSILEPQGAIDLDSTVTPRVTVCNHGNAPASFWTGFTVSGPRGTTYDDSVRLNLTPGESATAGFSVWHPDTLGTFSLLACTRLAADMQPGNDTARGAVMVIHRLLHDAAVGVILEPRDSIRLDSTVTPRAVIWNFGRSAETFPAAFGIDIGAAAVYADTETVTLASGESTVVSFMPWRADSAATYEMFCRALLSGDLDTTNDRQQASFRVFGPPVHDVAIAAIAAPAGTPDSGTVVTPAAIVANPGNCTERAPVWFRILGPTGAPVYSRQTVVDLNPGQYATVTFPVCTLRVVGSHMAQCSTHVVADTCRGNDTLGRSFTVIPPSPWHRMADIPPGPRNRAVRSGGALTASSGNAIYALKGNHTREFYAYDIVRDSWATCCSLPGSRGVFRGGALAYCPETNELYAVKGGNCNEFWAYLPDSDCWRRLVEVPHDPALPPLRAGACLAALDTGPVYLLKNSRELLAYDFGVNRWRTCAPPPRGSGRGFRDGTSMVAVRDYLYLLKNFDNDLYAYSTREDTWYHRSALPVFGRAGRKKRVRPGTAVTHSNDVIYVIKGGRSGETWRYCTFGDTWTQLDDLPAGISGRQVSAGGALSWADDRLWALKGNGTREFWSYRPAASSLGLTPNSGRQTQSSMRPQAPGFRFETAPSIFRNPHSAIRIDFALPRAGGHSLKLYDITGKLVATLAEGYRAAGVASVRLQTTSLSSGIYVVRLQAEGSVLTQRLIIE
jgi:hypothetical protein